MLSEITRQQIDGLRFTRRPLVICDVDEVVVHFTRDFEDYIATHDLWLDPASFALSGNVRHRHDHSPAHDELVMELVGGYFADRTLHQEPIDGAIEALLHIGDMADVVMLTNLPHSAGDHRRANLANHGLPFPVVTNSGPKGPAIAELAHRTGQTAVFIDDSPSFIASAYTHAPHVHLIHFLHDDRFARHVEPMDYVSLRTGTWDDVKPHILSLIGNQPP
jgi:hypothetical protein